MNNLKYYAVSFGVLMALSGSAIVLADEVDNEPQIVEEEQEEVSYVYAEDTPVVSVESVEQNSVELIEKSSIESVDENTAVLEETAVFEEVPSEEAAEDISLRNPGDGWGEDSNGTFYQVDGNKVTNSVTMIESNYYGFNTSGYLIKDRRFQWNSNWYQAKESGILYRNEWAALYDVDYYYGDNAAGINGVNTINGSTYYFEGGRKVVNSAFVYESQPYYADQNGAVHIMNENKWYDVPVDDRNMVTYLVAEGKLINSGVYYYENAYYYFYDNGMLARNTSNYVKDTTSFYVRSKDNGTLYENEWYYDELNGDKYYYGTEGRSAFGFYTINDKTYYFDSYGKQYRDTALTLDSEIYIFKENGDYYTTDTDGWYNTGTNRFCVGGGVLLKSQVISDGDYDYYVRDDGRMLVNDIAYGGTHTNASSTPYYYGANWEGKLIKEDFFMGYYFGSDGRSFENGFYVIDGFEYYMESGRYLTNTIRKILTTNYIFDIAGTATVAEEGITENINTYYVINGKLATGFYTIDGKDAYFEEGIMLKNGAIQVSDTEYMVADRQGNLLKESFYTFDYLKSPIFKYDSPGYPFYFSGTVYLDKDGKVVEGMKVIDGKNYYFSTEEAIGRYAMVTNSLFKYNGDWYTADANGVCRPTNVWDGWVVAGDARFFMYNNELVKNKMYEIAGSLYAFEGSGKLVKNGFWTARNPEYSVYRTDADGKIIKSQWVTVESEGKMDGEYYFSADGTGFNDFTTVDGKTYYFINGRKAAGEILQTEKGYLFRFKDDGSFTTLVPDGVYEGRSLQVVRNGVLVTNEIYPYQGSYYLLDGTGSSKWGEGVQLLDYYNYHRNEPIFVYTSADGTLYKYPQIQYKGVYAYFPTDAANLAYGYLENYFGNKYAVVYDTMAPYGTVFTYAVKNAPVTIKGVNYYADDTGVLHQAVTDVRHTLSLNGDIAVNFYFLFSDEVTSDTGARVDFTVEGVTRSIAFEDLIPNTIPSAAFYLASVDVTAAQMASKIRASVILSNGRTVYSEEYSVKKYCDNKLADTSTNTKLRNLLESLLNYGGYSQLFFNNQTEYLANCDLENTDVSDVTADMLKSYASVKTGSQTGLTMNGSTLSLDSKTTIKHYFTVAEGHSIDEYTFKVDGTVVTPIASGSMYYIEIPDIKSNDLDTMYTLTVGKFTIKYSALSYAYSQLNKASASDELKNTCRALYKYNQAANAYFGS